MKGDFQVGSFIYTWSLEVWNLLSPDEYHPVNKDKGHILNIKYLFSDLINPVL